MWKKTISLIAFAGLGTFPVAFAVAADEAGQANATQGSVAVGGNTAGRDVVINIYNYPRSSDGAIVENLLAQLPINDVKGRQRIESSFKEMTVSIPSDIRSVYVFFQSHSVQNVDGCQIKLQRVTPIEFVRRLPALAEEAKANPDLSLIVTAFSERRRWSAPVDIRVNGRMLLEEASYFCNNQNDGGWELR